MVLKYEPWLNSPVSNSNENILVFDSVSLGYEKDILIQRDLSFALAACTMTALLGPSGSGKSSLLYAAGLMLQPASGSINILGQRTNNLTDSQKSGVRSSHIGFLFQDSLLDPRRTVIENVTEGSIYAGRRSVDRARAESLLAGVGLDLPLGRRPGQVSGGQGQRIALCRALINAPELLLADEPTGNLDPDSAALVMTTMRKHAEQGAAVLIATHDRQVAADCDGSIELSPLVEG